MLERQAASLRANWHMMERAAFYWMKENGYPDARMGCDPDVLADLGLSSLASADGGIDIWAPAAVAQVKARTAPVGLADVQRHYGVAIATGRSGLFFSTSGYTSAAVKFSAGRLYLYVIEVGIATSVSAGATSAISIRLHSSP